MIPCWWGSQFVMKALMWRFDSIVGMKTIDFTWVSPEPQSPRARRYRSSKQMTCGDMMKNDQKSLFLSILTESLEISLQNRIDLEDISLILEWDALTTMSRASFVNEHSCVTGSPDHRSSQRYRSSSKPSVVTLSSHVFSIAFLELRTLKILLRIPRHHSNHPFLLALFIWMSPLALGTAFGCPRSFLCLSPCRHAPYMRVKSNAWMPLKSLT